MPRSSHEPIKKQDMQTKIFDLNNDELHHILSYCDKQSLLRFGQTCKKANEHSRDNRLWLPFLKTSQLSTIMKMTDPIADQKKGIIYKQKLSQFYKKRFLRIEREKRLFKTSKALYDRRISRSTFISATVCCVLVVISFLISVSTSSVVIPLILEHFHWGNLLTAFIPGFVFIFCFVTCVILHAITSNYLPCLDICRGVSHEEYSLKTFGTNKLKGLANWDRSIKKFWLDVNTSGFHYHFCWIVYIIIAVMLRLLIPNAPRGTWMGLMMPVLIPMVFSVGFAITDFVFSLRRYRNTIWTQYRPPEKELMRNTILIQCSILIIVCISDVCFFVQIAVLSAKLDGFLQSVSWHNVFIPIYVFIGIVYCIMCVIIPIIELIVVSRTTSEKCDTLYSAELYRCITMVMTLCITLPIIAFLILLGLKLDGLNMLWHFVFLPVWILFGLVIGPCCCIFIIGALFCIVYAYMHEKEILD